MYLFGLCVPLSGVPACVLSSTFVTMGRELLDFGIVISIIRANVKIQQQQQLNYLASISPVAPNMSVGTTRSSMAPSPVTKRRVELSSPLCFGKEEGRGGRPKEKKRAEEWVARVNEEGFFPAIVAFL